MFIIILIFNRSISRDSSPVLHCIPLISDLTSLSLQGVTQVIKVHQGRESCRRRCWSSKKKFLGGGRGPLALGLMFIRGGQRSSSVVSGFGILLLGGGVVSIGGSYDWVRVLGLRQLGGFSWQLVRASGGRLHPGSSPSGPWQLVRASGGRLHPGSSPSGPGWASGSWQLAWASGRWLHLAAGSILAALHLAVGFILAALHLVLGGHLAAGSILAALHSVLSIWQLAPSWRLSIRS